MGATEAAPAARVPSSSPSPGVREPLRIMGIDPGSQRTGIGVIDVDAAGRSTHVHHQTIGLLDNETFADRLRQVLDDVGAAIDRWQPQQVAIEKVFVKGNNAESALKLGQARGAAICAVVLRDLAVHEYAAGEVKQAVVGRGAAAKGQVQHMVAMLLGLSGPLQADAADALAIALTHAHTRATLGRTGLARSSWRRGR